MLRKRIFRLIALCGVLATALALTPQGGLASSHREAPLISLDPAADNTDLYAFVSPDRPDTVTVVANYIPLQEPAGGPNFANFDPSVLYEIKVDNTGDGKEDISYQFRFRSGYLNPNTYLYNTGPVMSLRACYVFWIMNVINRLSISIAKAKKCKPAKVSGNRS